MTPMTRWERFKLRFFCGTMGWHRPGKVRGFDGCSATAVCKRCERRVLQDSQGNWFAVSR